jgi:hypothetical protein
MLLMYWFDPCVEKLAKWKKYLGNPNNRDNSSVVNIILSLKKK